MTRPALFGDFLFEKIPHWFLWLGINSKINFGNLYFLRNHWFYLVFILIWIVLGKLFSYKPFNLPFSLWYFCHSPFKFIYFLKSFTSSLSFLLTSTKELFIYLSILLLCLITYYFFPFFFINVLLLFSMASFGCSFNNFLTWILINSIKFFLN